MDEHYPFARRPWRFGYQDFSPYFDPDTMYEHYVHIYQAYIGELNRLLARHPEYQDMTLEELLTQRINLPPVEASTIRFYAGGVYNHEVFFGGLSSYPAEPDPQSDLAAAILEQYGSMEDFTRIFGEAAHAILGVGWVWLNVEDGRLHIAITKDEDAPALQYVTPIFNMDTWEHSYFLKYRTDLAAYIQSWFRFVDWKQAERNYKSAMLSNRT